MLSMLSSRAADTSSTVRLPSEVGRFYDDKDAASFIKDRNQFWPAPVINQVRKQKRLEFSEGERQTGPD